MNDDHERSGPAVGETPTGSATSTGASSPNVRERCDDVPAGDDDPEPVTDILYSASPTPASRDGEEAD
jgi:hypothetical protein